MSDFIPIGTTGETRRLAAQGGQMVVQASWASEHMPEDYSVCEFGLYVIFVWGEGYFKRLSPENLETECLLPLRKLMVSPLAHPDDIVYAQYILDAEEELAKQRLTIEGRRKILASHRLEIMQSLIARDGGFCQMCGTNERLSIDHIIPITRCGSDDLDNLQLLCCSCNPSKGQRTQEEWDAQKA